MKTIITVDGLDRTESGQKHLQIIIPRKIGEPPSLCQVEILSGDGEIIHVDPKELIEVGEIIKQLYRQP